MSTSPRPHTSAGSLLVPLLLAGSLTGCGDAAHARTVTLSAARLAAGASLCEGWLYHPGDDPAGADPGWDDSGWVTVLPSLKGIDRQAGGWPGIGWFRLRVVLPAGASDLHPGLQMLQAGASEIWIDGRLTARFGTVAGAVEDERAVTPQFAVPVDLEPGVEHLIAVRYSNARGHLLPRVGRGFCPVLVDTRAVATGHLQGVRWNAGMLVGLIGLLAAFALLHLLLFTSRSGSRENLLFAVFALSIIGLLAAELAMQGVEDLAQLLHRYKLARTFSVAVALAALLLATALFRRRVGPGFYLLATLGAGALAWIWTRPAIGDLLPLLGFLGLVYFETIRLGVPDILRRRRDAWVVGVGFLVLAVTFVLSALRNLGALEVPGGANLTIGIGALALSFSIYLTRRVGRTHRELETRLDQVDSLTARTIAQERQAAHDEAERRLLEAENRRKQAELEEARQLQLAMLPRRLPRLADFDLAVHMSTANEVGGDYYDFRIDREICTLIVGDATGHGLRAGMVVAVAKSLFQTSSEDPPRLVTVLEHIDTALRGLRHRAAGMAVLLVRASGHRLEIASAGMPPVLLWRRVSGEIEEILVPAVPLGALAERSLGERVVELGAGDAALMMTDGIAELTDPSGRQLGYERVAAWFAEAAERAPAEAVERMVQQARAYLAGVPLPDDMTLVVLKARG